MALKDEVKEWADIVKGTDDRYIRSLAKAGVLGLLFLNWERIVKAVRNALGEFLQSPNVHKAYQWFQNRYDAIERAIWAVLKLVVGGMCVALFLLGLGSVLPEKAKTVLTHLGVIVMATTGALASASLIYQSAKTHIFAALVDLKLELAEWLIGLGKGVVPDVLFQEIQRKKADAAWDDRVMKAQWFIWAVLFWTLTLFNVSFVFTMATFEAVNFLTVILWIPSVAGFAVAGKNAYQWKTERWRKFALYGTLGAVFFVLIGVALRWGDGKLVKLTVPSLAAWRDARIASADELRHAQERETLANRAVAVGSTEGLNLPRGIATEIDRIIELRAKAAMTPEEAAELAARTAGVKAWIANRNPPIAKAAEPPKDPPPPKKAGCEDEVDNDHDGLVDKEDPDCHILAPAMVAQTDRSGKVIGFVKGASKLRYVPTREEASTVRAASPAPVATPAAPAAAPANDRAARAAEALKILEGDT